jgi:photosystem II stability/assembly factor-like uncharacterized protein
VPGQLVTDVRSLVTDALTPGTVYATTTTSGVSGVFKSVNAGGSWTPANPGPPCGCLTLLALDPVAPHTLYVARAAVFSNFPAIYVTTVFKSTDGAASWKAILTIGQFFSAIAVVPTSPSTVLVTTQFGIWRSADAGATWASETNELSSEAVLALAIDVSSPGVAYAGTDRRGVFKTTDAAATWNAVSAGVAATDVTAVAVAPTNQLVVYASVAGVGVFKSTNGGASGRCQIRAFLPVLLHSVRTRSLLTLATPVLHTWA